MPARAADQFRALFDRTQQKSLLIVKKWLPVTGRRAKSICSGPVLSTAEQSHMLRRN
jgi:hypothetical protein